MLALSRLWFCSLLLLLLSVPAFAGAKATVEASTLITGAIVVNPDGSVRSYTLDHPEQLSKTIVRVVAANVPEWTFRPYLVDGKPVAAKAAMSMRLVARKLASGGYSVAVRGASFVSPSRNRGGALKSDRVPPTYPRRAIEDRVSGTVYLVAQVDHQGTAENIAAEQVDLRIIGPPRAMERWRNMLADAATAAVRQWKFDVSSLPFATADGYTTVRIPVSFNLRPYGRVSRQQEYGQWQSYVPGPVNILPWLDQRQLAGESPDALPAGVIRPLDPNGLALRTRLDGS